MIGILTLLILSTAFGPTARDRRLAQSDLLVPDVAAGIDLAQAPLPNGGLLRRQGLKFWE
jgi:hypothetical protein